MSEPTLETIDALVGPDLVREVRRYGEEQIELLDRLGHASTKAEHSDPESRERIGWETLPSSAPASQPLPRGER